MLVVLLVVLLVALLLALLVVSALVAMVSMVASAQLRAFALAEALLAEACVEPAAAVALLKALLEVLLVVVTEVSVMTVVVPPALVTLALADSLGVLCPAVLVWSPPPVVPGCVPDWSTVEAVAGAGLTGGIIVATIALDVGKVAMPLVMMATPGSVFVAEAGASPISPTACCAQVPATPASGPTTCRAICPAPKPAPAASKPQSRSARRCGIRTVRVSIARPLPWFSLAVVVYAPTGASTSSTFGCKTGARRCLLR